MVSTKPGKIVNRKGIAEIFGVSLPTVDHWVRRGCPTLDKKGQEWQFDTSSVSAWRTSVEVGKALSGRTEEAEDDLTKRKLLAETELAELKLARESGQLITLSDVETVWMRMVGNARARLLAIPAKVAPLAHTAETVEEARVAIESNIHEALLELANGSGIEDDSESPDSGSGTESVSTEGDLNDQASTEINSKRVGRSTPKTQPGGERRTRPVADKSR